MAVVDALRLLLSEPALAAMLAAVFFVVFGGGRAIGLPFLFWHERPAQRFAAGAGVAGFGAVVLFVADLLDGGRWFPFDRGGFSIVLEAAGVPLLAVLVGRALLQEWRFRRSREHKRPRRGLGPTLAHVAHGQRRRVQTQVPGVAFLVGTLTAAALTVAVLLVADRIVLPSWAVAWLQWIERRRPLGAYDLGVPPATHLVALIGFFVLAATAIAARNRATPALAVCLLLSLVAAVHGAATFWLREPGLSLLITVGLLWVAGTRLRKLRLPALAGLYDRPVPYPPTRQAPADAESPGLPLPAAWSQGPKRRLIVVCSSGGGIRAATWTAAILGRLDEVAGFRAATRLMTGASGGMVGTAAWAARLAGRGEAPPAPGEWVRLVEAVTRDSLSPVVRRLVFHDVPLAFLPLTNAADRGRALEETWCRNLASSGLQIDLRLTFPQLRMLEAAGQIPSLVFSPMLVEDGRRLLFTNVDLEAVTDNVVCWLSSADSKTAPVAGIASQTAISARSLFGDHWDKLTLATAARLSAAFPYVSPGVVLPTEPRRRVVDAGYYDDYGIDLACGWLRTLLLTPEALAWTAAHLSGVLVIQIRDNVSDLSVNPDHNAHAMARIKAERTSALARGLEGLLTPVEGVLAARNAVSLFRNDAQLAGLIDLYRRQLGDAFLTTTTFELDGGASLSWYLTTGEIGSIESQATAPGIQDKIDAIARWLGSGRQEADQPTSPSLAVAL